MTISYRIQKTFLLLLLWLAFLAPADLRAQQSVSVRNAGEEATTADSESRYIIKPNDVLEVFVWKEPDLTRKVLVRPDGYISFPLVQDLLVAGIHPGTVKERIEERLKEYLKTPNVTVIVEAIRSYNIFVVGKVQKPGGILAEKPLTVLQALALAGGFQDYANEQEMSIVRSQGTSNKVFPFNYREVVKGRKSEQNIFLQPGDVVVVP